MYWAFKKTISGHAGTVCVFLTDHYFGFREARLSTKGMDKKGEEMQSRPLGLYLV